MNKLPPIGVRPPHLHTRILPCGHESKPGQPPAHEVCRDCYAKDRFQIVLMLEEKYELVTRIVGSPAQIHYARGIRAFKVDGIAKRIEDGDVTTSMMDKLDQFRTETKAQWFINNRLYRTLAPGKKTVTVAAREAAEEAAEIESQYQAAEGALGKARYNG